MKYHICPILLKIVRCREKSVNSGRGITTTSQSVTISEKIKCPRICSRFPNLKFVDRIWWQLGLPYIFYIILILSIFSRSVSWFKSCACSYACCNLLVNCKPVMQTSVTSVHCQDACDCMRLRKHLWTYVFWQIDSIWEQVCTLTRYGWLRSMVRTNKNPSIRRRVASLMFLLRFSFVPDYDDSQDCTNFMPESLLSRHDCIFFSLFNFIGIRVHIQDSLFTNCPSYLPEKKGLLCYRICGYQLATISLYLVFHNYPQRQWHDHTSEMPVHAISIVFRLL